MKLSRRWKIFLGIAIIAGSLLRLIYVNDMEYKEDEEYNYTQSQLIGNSQPWSWIGMPSGVYIQNPGMSVWVFAALAKISGARSPTELAHALQILSLLGIFLIIPFALVFLKEDEREPWFWACALAFVNPFQVFYQRKLWPEPFFPFFTMLMLMGWWRRNQFWGAFFWGLIGACLGQINMSGFFFAGGFFLWNLLFDRTHRRRLGLEKTRWSGWLWGSIVSALPLIPWAEYVLRHPVKERVVSNWNEAVQLKFFVFWITDSLGLHLGNPLGLLRGNSNLAQISDFIRYPLILGVPTYLNAFAHLVILGSALWIFFGGMVSFSQRMNRGSQTQSDSESEFATRAGLLCFGFLLTASCVVIRRYYMMVSFPLEFVWLTRTALNGQTILGVNPRSALALLWVAQLFVSANFVGYIHVNEGALQGDYGPAYHVILRDKK